MGRHVIGSTAEELRVLREDMHRMLKAGGDPPSGKWADLALLEPARDLKGDVTLTGNTVMYSFQKLAKHKDTYGGASEQTYFAVNTVPSLPRLMKLLWVCRIL
jgi:NifU-like protein involved in Fe-S cluster formation